MSVILMQAVTGCSCSVGRKKKQKNLTCYHRRVIVLRKMSLSDNFIHRKQTIEHTKNQMKLNNN